MNKQTETETQSSPFSVDSCLHPGDEQQGLSAVPERGVDENGCPPSLQCLIHTRTYPRRKLAPQQAVSTVQTWNCVWVLDAQELMRQCRKHRAGGGDLGVEGLKGGRETETTGWAGG